MPFTPRPGGAGIIRGTAVNADGRTSGITMPGVDAHERLIKHAYKFAHIDDPSLKI